MDTFHVDALGLSGHRNTASPSHEVAVDSAQNAVSPFYFPNPNEPLEWFPMRVAYGRAERVMAIRDCLKARDVEHFIPMTRRPVSSNGRKRFRLLPAVEGLVFIHSTQSVITRMKTFERDFLPLRYLMHHPVGDGNSEIIRIPDRQMDNFMRVASVQDDRVMFLGNVDFSQKIGQRVRVLDGLFKGVEGTVYRVRKDRRVVVELDGVTAVAISYISPDLLQELP